MNVADTLRVVARRRVPLNVRRRVRSRLVLAQRLLAAAGIGQSESAIARDSEEYWRSPDEGWWASNSHWRDSPAFTGNDLGPDRETAPGTAGHRQRSGAG